MNALKQRLGKWIAVSVLMLAGQAALAATANIDGFGSELVKTVQGNWAYNTKVNFDAPGSYKLTLTNFAFPTTIDALGVMVSSATQNIVDIVSYDKAESLSKEFSVNGGSYFLSIFAISDHSLNLGTLGIAFESAAPAEVPLPPALVLLMSGAMSLVGFVRRKQQSA
jgi:hypothetical protein